MSVDINSQKSKNFRKSLKNRNKGENLSKKELKKSRRGQFQVKKRRNKLK